MARRQRALVPQLWQRELGVRRARIDAAADRQHQRSSNQGRRAQISLAARPPPRRSSVVERSRPMRRAWTPAESWAGRGETSTAMPEIDRVVREIVDEMRRRPDRGGGATYIPQLAPVDAQAVGLVVIDADCRRAAA